MSITKKNGGQILCLPELCIGEDWLPEIKNEGAGMMLIPGNFYDEKNHNLFEDSKIAGTRMVRGKKLVNIYETEFGSFSVLICRDFGNFVSYLRGKVDMVFLHHLHVPENRHFQ